MSRRRFLIVVAAAAIGAGPSLGRGETIAMRRIGYLSATTQAADSASIMALLIGLRDGGWVEGTNLKVEYRWSNGNVGRLAELARDLLRNHVELIVTAGAPATIAARQSTRTVPIVFAAISDPVGSGVIASLSRPGGNATGRANMLNTISGKLLQLLRETFPSARRVTILWNPENEAKRLEFEEAAAAAKALSMQARSIEVRTPHELSGAFASIVLDRPDALLVMIDSTTIPRKSAIVAFAAMHRIPAIYQWRDYVDAGGLMSYGPNAEHEWRQVALLVGRILRGAAPADLPVEQPTEFELVINLRTAQALGISVPQPLLLRANDVIR